MKERFLTTTATSAFQVYITPLRILLLLLLLSHTQSYPRNYFQALFLNSSAAVAISNNSSYSPDFLHKSKKAPSLANKFEGVSNSKTSPLPSTKILS